MSSFKSWDQYVTEASQPDFEIPIGDDTIRIKAPTGQQIMESQRVMNAGGDVEEQLRLICGDAADQVLPLVKAAPAGVMNALVEDIMSHFGFTTGEASASSK